VERLWSGMEEPSVLLGVLLEHSVGIRDLIRCCRHRCEALCARRHPTGAPDTFNYVQQKITILLLLLLAALCIPVNSSSSWLCLLPSHSPSRCQASAATAARSGAPPTGKQQAATNHHRFIRGPEGEATRLTCNPALPQLLQSPDHSPAQLASGGGGGGVWPTPHP